VAPRVALDRYTDFVQRRRDELCFGAWAAGWLLAAALRAEAPALLPPAAGWPAAGLWLLLAAGVGLRVWAASVLVKNVFTAPRGPYALLRHPLYAGTLLVSLAFFLSLGIPVAGILLWGALVGGVFLPVIRKEERGLAVRFPAYRAYLETVPRFLPAPGGLGRALATSRADAAAVRRNYGLRALWFLILVPALNAALRWIAATQG
jgi:protein-S-isoprenylcysteine O-methyltransferase Ste14